MGKILMLALAVSFSLTACASPALQRDCLARKEKTEHVAAIADAELRRGITANDVRALLGEPDEIIQAPKLGDLEILCLFRLHGALGHSCAGDQALLY